MSNSNRKRAKLAVLFASTIGLTACGDNSTADSKDAHFPFPKSVSQGGTLPEAGAITETGDPNLYSERIAEDRRNTRKEENQKGLVREELTQMNASRFNEVQNALDREAEAQKDFSRKQLEAAQDMAREYKQKESARMRASETLRIENAKTMADFESGKINSHPCRNDPLISVAICDSIESTAITIREHREKYGTGEEIAAKRQAESDRMRDKMTSGELCPPPHGVHAMHGAMIHNTACSMKS